MELAFANPFKERASKPPITRATMAEGVLGGAGKRALAELIEEEVVEEIDVPEEDSVDPSAFGISAEEKRALELREQRDAWVRKSESIISECSEEDFQYPGILAMHALVLFAAQRGEMVALEKLVHAKHTTKDKNHQHENWRVIIDAEIALGRDPLQTGSITNMIDAISQTYRNEPIVMNQHAAAWLSKIATLFPPGSEQFNTLMNTAKDHLSRIHDPSKLRWVKLLIRARELHLPSIEKEVIDAFKTEVAQEPNDSDKRATWSAVATAEVSRGIDPTETFRLIEENLRAVRYQFSPAVFMYGLCELAKTKSEADYDVVTLIQEIHELPEPNWDSLDEVRTYHVTLATLAVLEARNGIDPTQTIEEAVKCKNTIYNTLNFPDIIRSIYEYLLYLNKQYTP